MAIGKPRLDDYNKLLHRFYEPLFLLIILLGKLPLGPHLVASYDPNNLTSVRRKFFKNLAYLCDFSKGGASTASIIVEERANCFVLWLALNDEDAKSTRTRDSSGAQSHGEIFLRTVISRLQTLSTESEVVKETSKAEFLEYCIEYASKRVTKEAKNLSSAVRKAIELLGEDDEAQDLIQWLGKFKYDPAVQPTDICQLAYQNRSNNFMNQLMRRVSELPSASELAKYLNKTRHYIGRLAHHVRAANELISDAGRFKETLSACIVEKIPVPICAPAPEADNHTHLPGIVNRMIRPHETQKWSQVTASADRLNSLITNESIVECYNNKSFKPRVHSEVQALEHFHKNNLRFAWNDRFVATSKMACFCCKLYFRHHPAHPVEPESHEKVYPNWGPIYLPGGRNHPEFAAHRQMMTKVIDGVREKALDMLLGFTNRWSFHDDSLTGITAVNSVEQEETNNALNERSFLGTGSSTADETLVANGSLAEILTDSDSSDDVEEGLDGGAPL